MRKLIFYLFFYLIGYHTIHAQPNKFYLKLNTGYGLFTPGSYGAISNVGFEWKSDRANFIAHDTSRTSHSPKGLGYGPRFGFGVGYIKNDFLNIGIDFEYQYTKGINGIQTINADEDNDYTSKDDMHYKLLTITPHVVFKALAKPKFYLYNKLGILFTMPFTLHSSGIRSGMDRQVIPNYNGYLNGNFYRDLLYARSSEGTYSYEREDKVKLGIGMNIAFGINFRINTQLRAFAEIFGNYSSLSFSKSDLTQVDKFVNFYTLDSTNFHVEQTDKFLSTSITSTKYRNGGVVGSDRLSENLGLNSEGYEESLDTEKVVRQKNTINMAAVGINVGITWRFK